jgi:hypothetical protein
MLVCLDADVLAEAASRVIQNLPANVEPGTGDNARVCWGLVFRANAQ